MDENIRPLLTWDNITLAISAIGFTGGIVFFTWASRTKKTVKPLESQEIQVDLLKQKVHLKDLSKNWISPGKQKKEQVHLKDLRHLWRKIENETPDNDDTVVHTFEHDRVRKFFHKYIHEKPYFRTARLQRSVIIQILHILDTEGECPSVVFLTGDPENSLGATTQGILRRVSLLNHSLNVAEIICQKIKKDSPSGAMLMAPDALVCALGHDLGKLPRFNADGYTHGAHPLTSNTILQDVKDFKLLKNRGDIENAIKRHHHPNLEQEKSPLLRMLGASDSKARVMEQDVVIGLDKERFENQRYVYLDREDASDTTTPLIETTSAKTAPSSSQTETGEYSTSVKFEDQGADQGSAVKMDTSQSLLEESRPAEEDVFFDMPIHGMGLQPTAQQKPARPKKKNPAKETALAPLVSPEETTKAQTDVAAAWKEQEFLHGIKDPTLGLLAEQAKTLTLEGWFNADQFLDDLEKQINRLDSMRICAFSMQTGKVYVPRETMVRLVQKQAKEAKIAWLTELDVYIDLSEDKDQNLPAIWPPILLGIVDKFRDQGFIDSSISPGFYGNYYDVTSKPIATNGTRFFTVFRAEAFKTTIPQLEKKKLAARLRNIQSVKIAKGAA